MGRINFLKSKEKKQLVNSIEKQWGKCPELIKEKVLIRTGKDKIYMANRDVERLPYEELRINNLGLYIAEIKGELRLSIEGAQIIGKTATKNVIEVDDAEMKRWFKGEDIEKEGEAEGFVILKHGKDIIGSAKHKEGSI